MAEYRTRVRYAETGAEGVAYYGSYYPWYDMAQEQFLRDNGLSYEVISQSGIHFVPIDMHSRFYTPAYFGEDITVRMKILSVSSIKTVVEYRVTKDATGDVVAVCTAVCACMNKQMRPLVLKKALPKLYEALKAEAEESKAVK